MGILGHRTSNVARPKIRLRYFIKISLCRGLYGNLTSTPTISPIQRSSFRESFKH